MRKKRRRRKVWDDVSTGVLSFVVFVRVIQSTAGVLDRNWGTRRCKNNTVAATKPRCVRFQICTDGPVSAAVEPEYKSGWHIH